MTFGIIFPECLGYREFSGLMRCYSEVLWPAESKSVVHFCQPASETPDYPEIILVFHGFSKVSGSGRKKLTSDLESASKNTVKSEIKTYVFLYVIKLLYYYFFNPNFHIFCIEINFRIFFRNDKFVLLFFYICYFIVTIVFHCYFFIYVIFSMWRDAFLC